MMIFTVPFVDLLLFLSFDLELPGLVPMVSRASRGLKVGRITWRPPHRVMAYTANTSTRWNIGAKCPLQAWQF